MFTTRMTATDHEQWFAARTLPDLANLTARWLEGDLASHPGYGDPGTGPDLETHDLVPMVALLNRAGWLTDCSQPGYTGGVDEQRAAVTGFVDWHLAERIWRVADYAGLFTFVTPVERRWWVRRDDSSSGVVVTREHGEPATVFGNQPHRRDVVRQYRGCRPSAVAAVMGSANLTVVDPVWGRNDHLWPVLAEAVSA
jgi:hypothetical protein